MSKKKKIFTFIQLTMSLPNVAGASGSGGTAEIDPGAMRGDSCANCKCTYWARAYMEPPPNFAGTTAMMNGNYYKIRNNKK